MGQKITFEWKETWATREAPTLPEKYPWEVHFIMGVSYPMEPPTKLLMPVEAYQAAIQAVYWHKPKAYREWLMLGDAGRFLSWLQEQTRCEGYLDWKISWPETFANAYRFARPENVQVLPWRELLRGHFDQKAYIADYDMFIDETYRRDRA